MLFRLILGYPISCHKIAKQSHYFLNVHKILQLDPYFRKAKLAGMDKADS